MAALTTSPDSMTNAAKPPWSNNAPDKPKARNTPMKDIGIIIITARGSFRDSNSTEQMMKMMIAMRRMMPAYLFLDSLNHPLRKNFLVEPGRKRLFQFLSLCPVPYEIISDIDIV